MNQKEFGILFVCACFSLIFINFIWLRKKIENNEMENRGNMIMLGDYLKPMPCLYASKYLCVKVEDAPDWGKNMQKVTEIRLIDRADSLYGFDISADTSSMITAKSSKFPINSIRVDCVVYKAFIPNYRVNGKQ